LKSLAKALNCFYEARKTSTVSKVEFLNPEMLSMLGLIYTDGFCARRESAPIGQRPSADGK